MISENWPWPNARVKGATDSLDELCTHLIIAMTECKGWLSSDELNKLYLGLDLKN